MADITRLFQSTDPHAADELLKLVYDELRRLAVQRLAREKPGQTLDPTGLVHEAYLRLVGKNAQQAWDGRGHFFAAAAEAGFAKGMISIVENLDDYIPIAGRCQATANDGHQFLRWSKRRVFVAEDHENGTMDSLPGWGRVILDVGPSRI